MRGQSGLNTPAGPSVTGSRHFNKSELGDRRTPSCGRCAWQRGIAYADSVGRAIGLPGKAIRLLIGFPPGGSTGDVGRIVAIKLSERLGQQIVVDNRGGAGGTIGADIAAKSAPDGYTLTVGTTSTHAVAAGAYSKLPYDPVKHFSPISLVAITPYLLVVNPGVPANSLAELVALAKSQPGKLNYASAGNGSTTHLAMEMLKDVAKINLVHIPYKGNAPADVAILANEVQAVFGPMPALLQNVKANKVRSLAVGTTRRSPALPDVATVSVLGFPDSKRRVADLAQAGCRSPSSSVSTARWRSSPCRISYPDGQNGASRSATRRGIRHGAGRGRSLHQSGQGGRIGWITAPAT